MTLSHFTLTATGIEVEIDDAPLALSALDALHLMHLLLRDQIPLQWMLLMEQYPLTKGADAARAEALSVHMNGNGGTSHVSRH